MMQHTPHPRNDQTHFYSESTKFPGGGSHHHARDSESVSVPRTDVTAEKIGEAKNFLFDKRNGISPLRILSSVNSDPWCLCDSGSLSGSEAIRRFLTTDPELLSTYNSLRSQEGILARLISPLPFIGKALPSVEFLKQFSAAYNLIYEMENIGLVNIRHHSGGSIVGGLRHGVVAVEVIISVSTSDFGQLVLETIQQEENAQT